MARSAPALAMALALAGVTLTGAGAVSQNAAREESTPVKIRIVIGGKPITATLADNATARDFASLLPLTLTLNDHAATEKVSDLPRRLTTAGAPSGVDPAPGDIAYYAPWGNLAIYYKDFGYSAGLVRLGTIDSGLALLNFAQPTRVTIERAE
jgi:hypothetical protein